MNHDHPATNGQHPITETERPLDERRALAALIDRVLHIEQALVRIESKLDAHHEASAAERAELLREYQSTGDSIKQTYAVMRQWHRSLQELLPVLVAAPAQPSGELEPASATNGAAG